MAIRSSLKLLTYRERLGKVTINSLKYFYRPRNHITSQSALKTVYPIRLHDNLETLRDSLNLNVYSAAFIEIFMQIWSFC